MLEGIKGLLNPVPKEACRNGSIFGYLLSSGVDTWCRSLQDDPKTQEGSYGSSSAKTLVLWHYSKKPQNTMNCPRNKLEDIFKTGQTCSVWQAPVGCYILNQLNTLQ